MDKLSWVKLGAFCFGGFLLLKYGGYLAPNLHPGMRGVWAEDVLATRDALARNAANSSVREYEQRAHAWIFQVDLYDTRVVLRQQQVPSRIRSGKDSETVLAQISSSQDVKGWGGSTLNVRNPILKKTKSPPCVQTELDPAQVFKQGGPGDWGPRHTMCLEGQRLQITIPGQAQPVYFHKIGELPK